VGSGTRALGVCFVSRSGLLFPTFRLLVLCTISTPFGRCTSPHLFSDACYERLLQLVPAGGEFLAPMRGLYLLQEYIDQPLTSSRCSVTSKHRWYSGRMSYVSGLQNWCYNLILMHIAIANRKLLLLSVPFWLRAVFHRFISKSFCCTLPRARFPHRDSLCRSRSGVLHSWSSPSYPILNECLSCQQRLVFRGLES
jgi:hypothetical protein